MVAHQFTRSINRGSLVGLTGTLLLGMTAFSPPLLADMYKWVDAQGQTHFTQEPPPPGVQGETVKPPPPPASPDQAKQTVKNWENYVDSANKDRAKTAEEEKKAADEKAADQEDCRRAQQSVASYSVPHALILQPDGSRTRITEEQRLAGLKDAQDRVAKFCK